jgi:xylulokinase
MRVYLGFDSSTQGLTAIAIDADAGRVVWHHVLSYDAALPEYGTRRGVLPSTDPSVAESSPLMWADALDRMMAIAAASKAFNLADVAAISGAAQQHGSVYLNGRAPDRLSTLDADRPLASQLDEIWSRHASPIWMDTSTSAQCRAITREAGGPEALTRLTGSRAFERFTGPQIRKFAETQPEAYARTERIHLVSSFLASLLIGHHAPLDPGDASGMNLMDLESRSWASRAIDATAPDLAAKLPGIVPSSAVLGRLSHYWVKRYGLPAASVIAWTGDNPSSLIGTGLFREGQLAVSLGTSDTVFGAMDKLRVDLSGAAHVFGAPTGGYMGLTCFRNGSLARERVRDDFGLSWDGFSRALRESPPGNNGGVMLPWFEPEITPAVLNPGVRRAGIDVTDPRANVRGLIEGQMMAMANHSRWMGVGVETIFATGGASANRDILQVMADVFDAPVHQLVVGNSACLGAALRAWHGDALAAGRPVDWSDIVNAFVTPRPDGAIRPVPEHVRIYGALKRRYAALEGTGVFSTDSDK